MITRLLFTLLLCLFSFELGVTSQFNTLPTTTCDGKQETDDCVSDLIFSMSDNLSINRPPVENSGLFSCKDFWDREAMSINTVCSYAQVVQMDLIGSEYNATQFVNINPYSQFFWDELKANYDKATINHFQTTVDKCFSQKSEFYDFSSSLTWRFRNTTTDQHGIDMLLVYCCTSFNCFSGPQIQDQLFAFPQCALPIENLKNESSNEWKTMTFNTMLIEPMNRDTNCYYWESLNEKNHSIGFYKPELFAFNDVDSCFHSIQLQKHEFLPLYFPNHYIFCNMNALNNATLSDQRIYGAVYSPLAQSLLKAKIVKEEVRKTKDKCYGLVDSKQHICFFNYNLINEDKNDYVISIGSNYSSSIDIFKYENMNCSLVFPSSKSVIPLIRCQCDYSNEPQCDMRILQFLPQSFKDNITQHLSGQFCDETQERSQLEMGKAVVGCTITMRIVGYNVVIDSAPMFASSGSWMYSIDDHFCSYTPQSSYECYCRANYRKNGNNCNTKEVFWREFQNLSDTIKNLHSYKPELKLHKVNCANFTDRSEEFMANFVDFRSHAMCYSECECDNNTGIGDSNASEVYIYKQVNSDVEIVPRIACELFFDGDLDDDDMIDGCKCLLQISTNSKPVCCCYSHRHE